LHWTANGIKSNKPVHLLFICLTARCRYWKGWTNERLNKSTKMKMRFLSRVEYKR